MLPEWMVYTSRMGARATKTIYRRETASLASASRENGTSALNAGIDI